MSHILYISAENYDRKHLENSKIGLENFWIYSSSCASWQIRLNNACLAAKRAVGSIAT